MALIRRLAMRAALGIADKDLAGRLQDKLAEEIELAAMLGEMNNEAGTPALFAEEPLKVLDEIEAALTRRSPQE